MQHVVEDVEETESIGGGLVLVAQCIGCWQLIILMKQEENIKKRKAFVSIAAAVVSTAASWQEGPRTGSLGSQGLFSVWICLRVLQQPPTIQEMQIRLP